MLSSNSREKEISDVRERMRSMIESAPEEKRMGLYGECALFYIASLYEMEKVKEPNYKLNSIVELSDELERYRNKKNAFRYMQDIQPIDTEKAKELPFGMAYARARLLRLMDDALDALGGYL